MVFSCIVALKERAKGILLCLNFESQRSHVCLVHCVISCAILISLAQPERPNGGTLLWLQEMQDARFATLFLLHHQSSCMLTRSQKRTIIHLARCLTQRPRAHLHSRNFYYTMRGFTCYRIIRHSYQALHH